MNYQAGYRCTLVPRLPFPVPRSPFPVPGSPVPGSRFPFPVSRFPFPVSRSPFPVPRSPFPVPGISNSRFQLHFPSASLASPLSVIGLPAAIPLGGVGGAFAAASSGLIIASKKLDSKIKKHQETVTLAIAKRDTVDRLLSKALTDNQISDSEFQLLTAEFSQYSVLKDAVRAKLTRQSSRPDVQKIKKKNL